MSSNKTYQAVVCVNYNTREVLSIDLFATYKDAKKFMKKDAKDVVGELKLNCGEDSDIRIENIDGSIELYANGCTTPECIWTIQQANA